MFKYPMIERANGAGRRAEEGSAAFLLFFYNLFWCLVLIYGGWEVLFQFLASRLFLYIYMF